MRTVDTLLAAMTLGVFLSSCSTGSGPTPWELPPVRDRGGIEGDAVTLEAPDPTLKAYLERVSAKIKSNWAYPCVKNPTTPSCDYQSATLTLEFGIRKDGVVQYIEVQQSAGLGFEVYDRHAVEAVARSSPFAAMSSEVVAALAVRNPGSAGMPVRARFRYVVDPTPVFR
jgi:TonB family protein